VSADWSKNNPRYAGKPLLRLLECYALWSIGELRPEDRETLESMTPMLQHTYGKTGAWHEVIASVMEFPQNLPASIKGLWEKNTAIAQKAQASLSPQQFAEMFVDQNLV